MFRDEPRKSLSFPPPLFFFFSPLSSSSTPLRVHPYQIGAETRGSSEETVPPLFSFFGWGGEKDC